MRYKKLVIVSFLSLALALGWGAARVWAVIPGVNEHVDITSSGVIGDNNSGGGTVSRDGRYVAFSSYATNLVPNDTNGQWDIFVRDRTANTITRVSVASDGTQANSYSQGKPSISDDGRYVVFNSNASNLVPNDTNATIDVFLHDMQTGATTLVSSSASGTQGNGPSQNPVISGDGKFVAFESAATNLVSTTTNHSNIYVKNLQTGNIQLISQAGGVSGNGDSWQPSLSCDGGVVAFNSSASNLVPNDTNGFTDAFVDVRAGGDVLTNITLGANNASGAAVVSCDGMHVAYTSNASNLVPSDTNAHQDAFKYDRRNQTTTLVSVGPNGVQGNGDSADASISSDGRLVAFDSAASNLVASDTNAVTDVFMRDTLTNTTYAVSVNSSGQLGNASSFSPGNCGFSGDGKYLYFVSNATNLIANDANNKGGGFLAQTGL